MSKGITIHGMQPDGDLDYDATMTYVVGDLDRENSPYLDEQGNPLATITIRPLSAEKVKAINKRFTRRDFDKAGRARDEVDALAASAEMIDYVIVDWTGLYTPTGQAIDCTSSAKRNLSLDRRASILQMAIRRESAEADAASFRQPA